MHNQRSVPNGTVRMLPNPPAARCNGEAMFSGTEMFRKFHLHNGNPVWIYNGERGIHFHIVKMNISKVDLATISWWMNSTVLMIITNATTRFEIETNLPFG